MAEEVTEKKGFTRSQEMILFKLVMISGFFICVTVGTIQQFVVHEDITSVLSSFGVALIFYGIITGTYITERIMRKKDE
jgi:hypothetical protein